MTVSDRATTLVREIDIKAPAAKVFAALTDPEQLPKWWGDAETYRVETMERDLRPDGMWRTTGIDSDGSTPFAVWGVYSEIKPPHLLEYTWNYDWAGPDVSETLVRFELEERDGVTHVRVTHSGFADEANKNEHDKGWTRVLGWLSAYVEG